MATYIIVKAQNGWDSDDKMVYQTGYPIDVFDHNALFGRIVPPKYCQFKIIDEDDFEAIKQAYNKEWLKSIDWEFVGHDYTIDGHRLKVFMKTDVVSTSGLNNLTRTQVETFLNRWGASIHRIATNEVVFDITVFDAVKSKGFWQRDVPLLGWTENSYDTATGVHSVEVNYSSYPVWKQAQVASEIEERGGEITKNIKDKITFDINRSDVFAEFKLDVKQALESQTYSRRQFKVPAQYVQAAIDAGGTLEITRQQFATYIYNRLND